MLVSFLAFNSLHYTYFANSKEILFTHEFIQTLSWEIIRALGVDVN